MLGGLEELVSVVLVLLIEILSYHIMVVAWFD